MTGSGFPVVEYPDTIDTTAVASAVVDITGVAPCPCDVELTVTRIDETTVRVTFDRAVLSSPWLTAPINWRVYDPLAVAPDLLVYSIAPEAVASPSYVDLTTDEQRTGVDYAAEAYRLEAA